MIQFKNEEFVFEFPVVPGSKDNYVFWEFMGKPSDIVHVKPGCTCTATFSITGTSEGGKIEAKFTESIVKADMSGVNKNSKEFLNGIQPFSKYLDVYLNDGKPLMVSKGMKKDYNPDKAKIRIYIKGEVDFKALKNFHLKNGFNKKIVNA